jgi:2-polyprenyl-3-methyl-5-hydroxy-6-metoxy-1,4-benzoquinol methylase
MDVLDLGSPVADLKRAERDIYLHHWAPWLEARRVLEVGCGVGRMTMPWLDRGAHVLGCDGDLTSLQRLVHHAAGRRGAVDVAWTSARNLPSNAYDFEAIVACEVLCYLPDAATIMADLAQRLRPGGTLLVSWEAPYGWAVAEDAPAGSLAEAMGGAGILAKPGDRWVRTVEDDELTNMLEQAGLQPVLMERTHYLTSGPLERCMPTNVSLEEILAAEAACRDHPVWRPLHRIWTAAATRER